MFKLGYNTNGFTSHSLSSAIDIIGSLGYRSIAISIDHHALNPFGPDLKKNLVKPNGCWKGTTCLQSLKPALYS